MTTRINITRDGTNILQWTIEDNALADAQVAAIVDLLNGRRPKQKPRRILSPEDLQRIATTWTEAPRGQRNKAVRDLLGVDSVDAANYVSRCRTKGLIDPSEYDIRRRRTSGVQTTARVPIQGQDIAAVTNDVVVHFGEDIDNILKMIEGQ